MALKSGLLEKLRNVQEKEQENGEVIPQDPVPDETPPATPSKRKTSRPAPTTAKPANTRLAKQVAADLTTLLQGGAAVWGFKDQCCAPVLEQQAQPIAEALTAILARNPALLAKFANTDIAVMTVQVIALGRALAPVGQAIYVNHVAKTNQLGGDSSANGSFIDQFPAYQPS